MLKTRRVAAVGVALLLCAAPACNRDGGADGSDGTEAVEGAGVSAEDRTAIEAVVQAFFAADTVEEVCETMSQGYVSVMIERGPTTDPAAPADDRCPSGVKHAEKSGLLTLESREADVLDVVTDGSKAAARVSLEGGSSADFNAIFLISNDQGWFVAGQGSPPPDFVDVYSRLQRES